MSKPSFTKKEQVEALAKLWNLPHGKVETMLEDYWEALAEALERGERIYLDDFGTIHHEIKAPVRKKLPGAEDEQIFAARVNVDFEMSENLEVRLIETFAAELEQATEAWMNSSN